MINGKAPNSLFIADDHTLFVDALVMALMNQTSFPVQVLGTSGNGEDLLHKMQTIRPEFVTGPQYARYKWAGCDPGPERKLPWP